MTAVIEVLLSELACYTDTISKKFFFLRAFLPILCILFPFLSALCGFNSLVIHIVKKGTMFMNSLLSSLLMFLLSFPAEFISGSVLLCLPWPGDSQ